MALKTRVAGVRTLLTGMCFFGPRWWFLLGGRLMVGDGRWWFGLDFLECLPPSLGKMISNFDGYIETRFQPHCTYDI